jgi:DNA-binding CsgD family transcriptional regulator
LSCRSPEPQAAARLNPGRLTDPALFRPLISQPEIDTELHCLTHFATHVERLKGEGRLMGGGGIRAEQIYEAAFDEEAFARLPELLAEATGAKSGLVIWVSPDRETEVANFHGLAPDVIQELPDFLPDDIWTHVTLKKPNQFLNMANHVPEKVFAAGRLYNELIRPKRDDTFHCMGIGIQAPWGFGVAAVHRGQSQTAFDVEAEAAFRPIIGHLNKVLRVRGDLHTARRETRLAKGALDSLALAMMTVGRHARLLSHNVAAEELFRRRDGLALHRGVLTGATAASAERLSDAIARATASEPSGSWFRIERGPVKSPYLVSVLPQPGSRSTALVSVRDPDAESGASAERLRTLFGLTAAEAAIACELAAGHSLEGIAQMRGSSVQTVRVQLKAVAAKMGVSRQAEIVAQVAMTPPLRG